MSIPNLKRIFLSPPHMSGEEMRLIKKAFESNYIAPCTNGGRWHFVTLLGRIYKEQGTEHRIRMTEDG